MPRRTPLSPAFLVTVAIILGGCGSNPASTGDTLQQALLSSPPSGYTQTVDQALTPTVAQSSTAADPRALKAELTRDGLTEAWARVWTRGAAYRSIIAYQIGTAFGAESLREFLAAQFAQGHGVVAYADPQIPGASGFTFYAQTRSGTSEVFCQEVLFAVTSDVFVMNDCDVGPRAALFVLSWAEQQYRRALTNLGATPPPSSS